MATKKTVATKVKPREPQKCGTCGATATYICECGEQIK